MLPSNSNSSPIQQLPPQPTQTSVSNTLNLNQQKIKLYLSLCEQPIPDIINQPITNIYSHFKFYFNDQQLLILLQNFQGYFVSALHQSSFQQCLQIVFRQWINSKKCNDSNQNNDICEKENNQTLEFRNFIAFVQYWIRNSPQIIIQYRVYDQLVTQCVQSFLENSISTISFKLAHPKKPQKSKSNKNSPNPNAQSLTSSPIEKRLQTYFTYFSKMKNYPFSSCNSTYTNNITKTFDQIHTSYTTLNTQQWISFVKVFNLDKIFQSIYSHQIRSLSNKTPNSKSYLPVKYIKWNNTLHYFVNLFDKFANQYKQMEFQGFVTIIKKLFQVLFDQQHQQNTHSQQQTPPQSSSLTPQQLAIHHLNLQSQQQFNTKLRSLGIFVPYQQTSLPSPSLKSYKKIKPRYLNKHFISPVPVQNTKNAIVIQNSNNNNNKTIVLPFIGQKKNSHMYTIQSLMGKNQENRKKDHSYKSPYRYEKQQKYQTTTIDKQNNSNNSYQKQILKSTQTPTYTNSIKSPSKSSQPQPSPLEQQDQYLNQYYLKNKSNIVYNNPHLTSNIPDRVQTYHFNQQYQQKSVNPLNNNYGGYHMGNGYGRSINILKKIDERIDKIHQKLL